MTKLPPPRRRVVAAHQSSLGGWQVGSDGKKVRCMFIANVTAGNAYLTQQASLGKDKCPPAGYDSVVGEVRVAHTLTIGGAIAIGKHEIPHMESPYLSWDPVLNCIGKRVREEHCLCVVRRIRFIDQTTRVSDTLSRRPA